MAPYTVTVHPFASPTRGSCAYERGDPSAENALVFIGGLTSGPGVSDLTKLCQSITGSENLSYSVWEFRMRSSYTGFGFSSLANDAEDLAAIVAYLRQTGKKKVVVMGHSTGLHPFPPLLEVCVCLFVDLIHDSRPGCQDCLEYTNRDKYNSPPVDGYILLAPVSDREAAAAFTSQDIIDATVKTAQDMLAKGKANDTMPSGSIPPIFASPITAYRWNSLAAKGYIVPVQSSPCHCIRDWIRGMLTLNAPPAETMIISLQTCPISSSRQRLAASTRRCFFCLARMTS